MRFGIWCDAWCDAGPGESQEEAGWLSGLVVNTERLRVERVACEFRREIGVQCSREMPPSTELLVGVTVDALNPSWEVFDGSGLACATLSIWAYCLSGGDVRAVPWSEEFRALIEIPGLRRGMRIEARFSVGGIDSKLSRSGSRIVVDAVVSVEAIVLETVVLNVVTGVEPSPVEAAEAPTALSNAQAASRRQAAGSRFLPGFLPGFLHLLYAFTSRLKAAWRGARGARGPGAASHVR